MINFLTPAAFALAALLPLIVIMYLLKLKRTEQVVSSIYLWRRMVRDSEANAPWQKLRRNLLMFLQLLFLALLIIVLAQPFTWTEGASGGSVIFIIDHSASMGGVDTPPNRLEAAKDQARQMVENLPDDARITVMAASENAQVLASQSTDRRQVFQAIESIRLSTGGSNLSQALGLAAAIATRQPDTEVIVLSDGRAVLPERLALRGRIQYMPVGVSGENQAISLLTLEAGAGGEALTAFAQVSNYGSQSAGRRLELYADGLLIGAYDLQIEPGAQQAIVSYDVPPETHLLEGRLTGQDVLPLDDHAWSVRPSGEPAQVTLVSEGNRFLETALSLLPGLEVTLVTPEAFEAGNAGAAETDADFVPRQLTIFDAYVPVTATLPAGNLLFIAPPRSTPFFTVSGRIEQPRARVVDANDPLVTHLNVSDVNILDSVRVPLPPWGRVVISGDTDDSSGPLLFVGQVEGRRVGVLAFDLRRSDLPLNIAFPLLMANLTDWLAPGRSGQAPEQITPGQAVSIELPPDVASVTATRPDGSRSQLSLQEGRLLYADTTQLGVYRLVWRTGSGETTETSFAVNLFSPGESNLAPAMTLPLFTGEAGQEAERSQQARREWWRPLAYLALLLLVGEWLVYNRANLVRLSHTLRKPPSLTPSRGLRETPPKTNR